jgi:potassium efflux system protein
VGGVTGTVMRIRMRATTIEDWDRKELVVPNKEFITNQLVNWTLGDSILRVIVKVGIAYGSDTVKATKLLYEVAAGNPKVLDDPAPRVVFQEFGDSSLNFELRFFVGNPETVRVIPHEMNMAIDAAFRAAGIEIAFPQRDIHIRSVTHDLHGALQGPGGKA